MPFRHTLMLILLVTASLACSSANRELFPADPAERDIEVHVISHGWHVGIAIPVDAHFEEIMPSSLHITDEQNYAEFGWGDRDFYMDPSPGIWTTIKGGLIPSTSTVHVASFTKDPPLQFFGQERVTILLTDAGYRALLKRMEEYFTRDEDGEVIVLGDGLYADSRFYKSPMWYYVPKTSNMWVALLLDEAGLPINTSIALFASNVIRQTSKVGSHHQ